MSSGPSPSDALSTALANRYRIERELGTGGMATVYLAHDVRHDRQVALKVLKPDVAESLGRDRFVREIRMAARLTHPNILSIHDYGSTETAAYSVTELLEGQTLRQRLLAARRRRGVLANPLERRVDVMDGERLAGRHPGGPPRGGPVFHRPGDGAEVAVARRSRLCRGLVVGG